ncbi:MAG TPA: capsid cement protein [Methylophilaceae bacterium]|nr:capsid cement protein [Methylophilaceae bacterium]
MSQQAISILDLSCLASAAVAQYRGVDFNDVQIAAAGAKIKGIAKRPAAIGEPFEAVTYGTATCEAGAAIAKGVAVTMDNQGRVVAATAVAIAAGATAVTSAAANGANAITGGDLPQFIVGHALEAAAGAGAFIEVLLSR